MASVLAALLIGCVNPSNNDDGSNKDSVTFSEGWWKFSTENSNFYLNYDAQKNITRAGDDSQEYADVILNNIKNSDNYKWDKCLYYSNQDARISFKKISDSELPDWNKNPLLGLWKFDTPLHICYYSEFELYKDYEYCKFFENGFRIYTVYPTEQIDHDDSYYIDINFTKTNNILECKPILNHVKGNVNFDTVYNIIGNKIYFSKMFDLTNVSATKTN